MSRQFACWLQLGYPLSPLLPPWTPKRIVKFWSDDTSLWLVGGGLPPVAAASQTPSFSLRIQLPSITFTRPKYGSERPPIATATLLMLTCSTPPPPLMRLVTGSVTVVEGYHGLLGVTEDHWGLSKTGLCFVCSLRDRGDGWAGMRAKKSLCAQNGPLIFCSLFKISNSLGGKCCLEYHMMNRVRQLTLVWTKQNFCPRGKDFLVLGGGVVWPEREGQPDQPPPPPCG